MPTYEYECTNCNKVFEVFQQITEAPLKKCPKCNKKISRLIGGGSGVIFKGTGFYATDYRKAAPARSCSPDKKGCSSCPHAK